MAMTEDFSTMLDIMGEDVTATPGEGGSPESIRAIIDTNFLNQEVHPERGIRFATATIIVSGDDWTPDDRDRFNFRGYNWEMAKDGWSHSKLNEDSTNIYRGNLIRMIS